MRRIAIAGAVAYAGLWAFRFSKLNWNSKASSTGVGGLDPYKKGTFGQNH